MKRNFEPNRRLGNRKVRSGCSTCKCMDPGVWCMSHPCVNHHLGTAKSNVTRRRRIVYVAQKLGGYVQGTQVCQNVSSPSQFPQACSRCEIILTKATTYGPNHHSQTLENQPTRKQKD